MQPKEGIIYAEEREGSTKRGAARGQKQERGGGENAGSWRRSEEEGNGKKESRADLRSGCRLEECLKRYPAVPERKKEKGKKGGLAGVAAEKIAQGVGQEEQKNRLRSAPCKRLEKGNIGREDDLEKKEKNTWRTSVI